MHFFAFLAVLAIVVSSDVLANSPPTAYRPVYRYNLSLNTGNHTFKFQGLTKITLNVKGQKFSYTNLSTYGTPNYYVKPVELDFSLEDGAVRNVSVEWDYKWLDFAEILIFKPLLVVKSFTITPVRKPVQNIRYRSAPKELDLDSVNLIAGPHYDLDSQIYDPNNRYPIKTNKYLNDEYNVDYPARPNHHDQYNDYDVAVHELPYNTRPNHVNRPSIKPNHPHRPLNKLTTYPAPKPVYHAKVIKFCPSVHDVAGVEAKHSIVLTTKCRKGY